MSTIIMNATVITVNPFDDVYKNGALGFEQDRITYIGQTPEDVSGYDHVIDAKSQIIMPGLINTHGHTAMSLLRGYADDLPLQEWLETKMWPLEAQFNATHVKAGTRLSMIEMIRTGTTSFVDMYDQMDHVAEAVDQSGMRAALCRGIIGFPVEAQATKLVEATSFARNWHGKAQGRITTMMSPHAPYTCPPDYIEKIVDRAHELDVPIHIHMSETAREVKENERDYGLRPPAHLERLGVYSRPTLVAHAVHLTDEEIELLAAHRVHVSHNPMSNLKLASGVARVPELLKKGVNVSLGTDSAASNNNLNLFEELKMAALLHKGVNEDPLAVSASQAIRMATQAGAEAMFIGEQTGSLEVGKKADFILIRTDQAHFQPFHDPVSHIVYASSGSDVQAVWIDGKQIMAEGALLTIDEEKVIGEANRLFQALDHS